MLSTTTMAMTDTMVTAVSTPTSGVGASAPSPPALVTGPAKQETDSDDGLSVGVRAVDTASPFGGSRGTDNVIIIQSDRYSETPLVVQGPGAGPDVTAAGLLADLVKAAELMP